MGYFYPPVGVCSPILIKCWFTKKSILIISSGVLFLTFLFGGLRGPSVEVGATDAPATSTCGPWERTLHTIVIAPSLRHLRHGLRRFGPGESGLQRILRRAQIGEIRLRAVHRACRQYGCTIRDGRGVPDVLP